MLVLRKDALRGSFCGKHQGQVRKLIAGPTVFICDECVFTAAHMMVYVKPEKARKVTDEPLYDELSKALDKACEEIVTLCGTCPADIKCVDDSESDCDHRCNVGIERSCWRDYFLGRF